MVSGVFGKIPAVRLAGFLTALIVTALFSLSVAAYAEEIIYTGDKKQLQEMPSWFFDTFSGALFPETNTTPLSSGNKVTVNYNSAAQEVTTPNLVLGGLSKSENVSGNSVVLLNGMSNKIFGGWSSSGMVADNAVTISGNFAVKNGSTREGWYLERDVYGGHSDSGKVTGNTVSISGGLVTGGGSISGGRSGSNISKGNTLDISAGSVEGDIYGGRSGQGDATDNIITISGGWVEGSPFGGSSGSGGSALRNAVIISGGSVGWAVYGGYCYRGSAIGNTVTISGGSVGENVYGGYGQNPSTATGNTVTISGRPELTKSQIFGGYVFGGYSADAFTDNILNLKSSGISVKTVGNFEYYNFYLPQNLTAGGVMLNATKPVDLVTEPLDLKGTTVAIFLQGAVKFRKGDKIALIKSAAGISNAPKNKSCQAQQAGVLYEFSIYTDKNNLWAKLEKISPAAK